MEKTYNLTSSCGSVEFNAKTGVVVSVDEHLNKGEQPYLALITHINVDQLAKLNTDLAKHECSDILFAGYWHTKDGAEIYEKPCYHAVKNCLEAGGTGFGVTIAECDAAIANGESS